MRASIKLVALARSARWMAWAAMLGYLAALAWAVLARFPNALAWVGVDGMSLELDLDDFRNRHRWAVLLTDGPADIVMTFGLLRLSMLMRLYEQGKLFDSRAVVYLRQFSNALVGSQVYSFLMDPLLRIIVRMQHPPGEKIVAEFHSSDMWMIYISVLFVLISRVVAEAYFIAEDNAQIV